MNNIENTMIKSNSSLINQEYIFALVAILFGVLFIFLTPPFSGKNEIQHFALAYAVEDGQEVIGSKVGEYGFMIPKSIKNTYEEFAAATEKNEGKLPDNMVDVYSVLKLHPNDKIFLEHNSESLNFISYIPSIIGVFIGKMINNNPIYLLWITRITGLVFYLLIVFFAIRMIPIYKNVFMLISLVPAALFQAGTVNNDLFALSLSLLLIATVFKMGYQTGKASVLLLIIYFLSSIILSYAKGCYFLIPLILLFVPNDKFNKPIIKYVLLVLILSFIIINIFINSGFLSTGIYNSSNLNSGFLVDGLQNTKFMMSNPFNLLYLLFMNLISQGGEWMKSSITGFGNQNLSPAGIISFIHILVILIVSFFNGNKDIQLSSLSKYLSFGISLISILTVIATYLIFASPVGSYKVEGISGVYFLPILPLILIVLYNTSYRNDIFEKYGSLILGIFSIIMLTISALFIGNNF